MALIQAIAALQADPWRILSDEGQKEKEIYAHAQLVPISTDL